MNILIKNGTLVLPHCLMVGDLRIWKGRIAEIGVDLPILNAQIIDATDKLIFPGFIDTHTHLEMNKGLPNETADDWATGTRAALVGGTTTVLDFSEAPRGGSLNEALNIWRSRADGVAACHYGFHMTLKEWNPTVQAELRDMRVAGISSYKIYMAYENLRVDDATALQILEGVAAEGGIVGCHCEDGDLVSAGIRAQLEGWHLEPSAHPLSRPPHVEGVAVKRWLELAEQAGVPVNIVHLSTQDGLEAVRSARSKGQALYVETCPQYLLLDESRYHLPDFESAKFVLSPPLRGRSHVDALWRAVEQGEIDTIGTDHCSFHFNGVKELGRNDFSKIPNGIPGIEHRPVLLYSAGVHSARISPLDFSRLLSQQPAKLFGMYPQKGCIAVGSDADLVIWDPDAKWTISAGNQTQAVDYTPYEGLAVTGRVDTVLLCGKVAVEHGKVVGAPRGQYVRRGPTQAWRL